jgi:hypothetical protein
MRRSGALALTALLVLLVLPVLLAGGCRSSSTSAQVALDGTPRRPTDQGIATKVSRSSLTLDGARTYKVSPGLQSFSTYSLATTPLAEKQGQYVEIGARGGTVYWIASIADVLGGKTVYYTGRLRRIEKSGDAVFADGTVLRLAPSVRRSSLRGQVVARIDAPAHEVVELRAP